MKIKKEFILTTGNIDSDNDIILPSAMKLPIDKSLRIYDHFDVHKQIGIITSIKEKGNSTIAIAMFDEDPTGLYPAIGFQDVKSHVNIHGGRTYDEIKIMCVGVSPAPNSDPNIQAIK